MLEKSSQIDAVILALILVDKTHKLAHVGRLNTGSPQSYVTTLSPISTATTVLEKSSQIDAVFLGIQLADEMHKSAHVG